MLEKISGYFERRRKARLHRQWVNQGGLPPEEIPPEMPNAQSAKETDLATEDITHEDVPGYTAQINIDRGMVRLPFRYVLLGLFIIALLLVTLSVVSTILSMRSC